jgi:magnesium transporter
MVLAGTLIPLTLNRFGVDPAVAAGPFLTTTDVLGFFVFLGLASVLLLRSRLTPTSMWSGSG